MDSSHADRCGAPRAAQSDRRVGVGAQVACDNVAQVTETLSRHPNRTLSRLMAARRLLPFRPYVACVVPVSLFRTDRPG